MPAPLARHTSFRGPASLLLHDLLRLWPLLDELVLQPVHELTLLGVRRHPLDHLERREALRVPPQVGLLDLPHQPPTQPSQLLNACEYKFTQKLILYQFLTCISGG